MASKKSIIYVGGLDSEVNEELLHASFIVFGDIKSVQIPKDFKLNKTRGFGFVEFELEEDCAAALENMHGAELCGKVLRCSVAKPMSNVNRGQAIWNADDWISNQLNDGEGGVENLRDFEGIDQLEMESLCPQAT